MRRLVLSVALLAVVMSAAACIFIKQRVQVQKVEPRNDVNITTSVKAHLKDGSTVTYPTGVKVSGNTLIGEGFRHDLLAASAIAVREIPLDDVLGMESFQTRTNRTESVIVSTLATVGATVGGALLAIAIFGSCPTVYSGDGTVEEAELFSSSIAPLFEARDVDRLRAQPDADGILRLEVRNEAMETHYINHLQVLEVEHAADEFVLPAARGDVVAVRNITAPDVITDRRGQNIRDRIVAVDEKSYASDPRTVDGANIKDLDDWIDFTVPLAPGSETATLVFRMRNSLLSTTLLYEIMLGRAGARAIDWLNRDLSTISTAVELGRWHQKRAGLHISVWRDGAYREVDRIPDAGPISWHDVSASIPVHPGETSLRIRLSFLADHWRIDRIGIAANSRSVVPRTIPISAVREANGLHQTEGQNNLSAPDNRYLQTNPSQHFFLDFNAGRTGKSRTFLLSSLGYYIEWIRGTWIQSASADAPFVPNDESLVAALAKWTANREAFEKRFRESRVPVR